MKKVYTLFVCLVFAFNIAVAQQVRENVVVEIGTGTWCGYCPGAATAADELHANGIDVAIIENHNGDIFANVYSNARNSYYGVPGYPTAYFDGILNYVGGIGCPNPTGLYSTYLTKVNQRLAVFSDFSIEMDFTHAALEYDVIVTIQDHGAASTDNLVLHLVVTESHIEQSWQGCMDDCNFVNRLMTPNQYGTPLDFAGGDEITLDLDFEMDPNWMIENCELIAFVQNTVTKEVHQGIVKSMATPDFDYDAEMFKIGNIPEGNCSGTLSPEVVIKNWGAETLTSLKINYLVNDGELYIYDWSGNLEFLDDETISLDEIFMEVEEENEFMVYSTEPNGVPDENTINDTLTAEFGPAYTCDYYRVSLLIRTDGFPNQTTYDVEDENGNVLYSGGPFEQANFIYKDTFNLYVAGCYKFIMYDSGGDGLAGGFYVLRDFSGAGTIGNGAQFGSLETTEFNINWVGIDDIESIDQVHIFPNPFETETNIHINVGSTEEVIIQVYNALGELTYYKSYGLLPKGEHSLMLTRDDLSSGINFVQIRIGEKTFTEKVILNR